MMTNQEVLTVYAAMAELTEQMLSAATAGEWDDLVLLEQRCAAHARALQADEPQQPMAGEQRERKVELIRQMLTADRKIRDLTMPWMAQLSALINSTGAERRLASAYGGV
ncbi:flagellar protein FliT [Pseudoduganella namucuonensis]|uniref:Flagellar protein FliT n=1 Tax=Pseudoduganella namucuonensis TaxID=1035707 RepID=A0A1I7KZR3_9BURK|nr:flagellar protein FliT [Pseudoduganella namucuonensis]SFV02878.1 flagellar protein FliT [Pseudoduganella namucuonensis]